MKKILLPLLFLLSFWASAQKLNFLAPNNVNPGIQITTDVLNLADGTFNATFTANRALTGFANTDVTCTNCTVGSLSTSDNITFTSVITNISTDDSNIVVSIAAGVCTDAFSHTNLPSNVITLGVSPYLQRYFGSAAVHLNLPNWRKTMLVENAATGVPITECTDGSFVGLVYCQDQNATKLYAPSDANRPRLRNNAINFNGVNSRLTLNNSRQLTQPFCGATPTWGIMMQVRMGYARNITIGGSSGAGTILINGTKYTVTFATSTTVTAANFVTNNAATILQAEGMIVTSATNNIIFENVTTNGPPVCPTFTNTSGTLSGTAVTTSDALGNTIFDNNQSTGSQQGIRIQRTTGNVLSILASKAAAGTEPVTITGAATLTESDGWTTIIAWADGLGASKASIQIGNKTADTGTVSAGDAVFSSNDIIWGCNQSAFGSPLNGSIGAVIFLNRKPTAGEITTFKALPFPSTISTINNEFNPIVEYDYDPDVNTLYQDVAFTTPATSNNDPVAIMKPKLVPNFGPLGKNMTAGVDMITLSGSSGTANVNVFGTNYTCTFSTNLQTTASNFVATNGPAILANADVLVEAIIPNTGSATLGILTFWPRTTGSAWTTTTISNATGTLTGTVAQPERPALKTNYINSKKVALMDGIWNNFYTEDRFPEPNGKWTVIIIAENTKPSSASESNIHIATENKRLLFTGLGYAGNPPGGAYFVGHTNGAAYPDDFALLKNQTSPGTNIMVISNNRGFYNVTNGNKVVYGTAVQNTSSIYWRRFGQEEVPSLTHSVQWKGGFVHILKFNGFMNQATVNYWIDYYNALYLLDNNNYNRFEEIPTLEKYDYYYNMAA